MEQVVPFDWLCSFGSFIDGVHLGCVLPCELKSLFSRITMKLFLFTAKTGPCCKI